MKLWEKHAIAICIAITLGMGSSVQADIVTDGNWYAEPFPSLNVRTRSIEFDSSCNLYIETIGDDGSGEVRIEWLEASSGYDTPLPFMSYPTTYHGVTGLDFDGNGSLYVSERSEDGDAGIIRKIDVATKTLVGDVLEIGHHRPTGIDADILGNVYYTGRKESDGTFGHVFQIDSEGTRSRLIEDVVVTGIALDNSGNIFISTPERTDLPLESSSIYMFDPEDLSNPLLIATLDGPAGELTFDDAGNLYAIDNTDHHTITRFSLVPVPPAVWLFGSGLIGLLCMARRKRHP